MSMVKSSPTALNFGYGFFLLVTFLGHPVPTSVAKMNLFQMLNPPGWLPTRILLLVFGFWFKILILCSTLIYEP